MCRLLCNHPWKATLRTKLCEDLIFLLCCKSLVFKNKKLLHSSVATLSIFMIFRSSVSLSVFLDNRSCKVFSYLPWVKEYPNRKKTILKFLIYGPWENRLLKPNYALHYNLFLLFPVSNTLCCWSFNFLTATTRS